MQWLPNGLALPVHVPTASTVGACAAEAWLTRGAHAVAMLGLDDTRAGWRFEAALVGALAGDEGAAEAEAEATGWAALWAHGGVEAGWPSGERMATDEELLPAGAAAPDPEWRYACEGGEGAEPEAGTVAAAPLASDEQLAGALRALLRRYADAAAAAGRGELDAAAVAPTAEEGWALGDGERCGG